MKKFPVDNSPRVLSLSQDDYTRMSIIKQNLDQERKGSVREALYTELRNIQKRDPLNF